MEDKMKLTIEINNKHPVELTDLAKSMMSLADEYRGFLAAHDAHIEADDVKLYVKEIRTGSIIQELVAMAPYALPFVEHSKTIVEYAEHLKTLYEWFAGKSDKKPQVVEKTTLQNLSTIVEPVAKDHGSQMNFGAMNVQGDFVLNVNLTSTEANAVQNAIRREIDAMREPVTGTHEQVVMYWAQARAQADHKPGDKARIESLYRGDVKVRFANDGLKAKMLYDEAYPFRKAFVVDVSVETIEDKPVLYKVLEFHEAIDRDA
jgi:hypothetical protein